MSVTDALPREQPPVTLFIDRDLWSRRLDTALREAGIAFEAHRDHFDDDTPDEQWLRGVGRRGWVVVTRDQRIRYRPNELRAVHEARLHLFALTSGSLSAAESAAIVVRAWPAIVTAVSVHSPPRLWSITRGGEIRLLKR